MTILDLLAHNAASFPDEIALTELDYHSAANDGELSPEKRELTWGGFYRQSCSIAGLLTSRGYKRGNKLAILLYNSLEWLPIYFGVLLAGLVAVPLNFREDANSIKYCLSHADCVGIVSSREFSERISAIRDELNGVRDFLFVGEDCPDYAESLGSALHDLPACPPDLLPDENDDAAIYFSSGTTGSPKAILHTHSSLYHAALTEQKHHGQTHDDVFLCIPPLYHTGAKMHWFGSLLAGGRAVILKGIRPEQILHAAASEQCTVVWLLVPWAQDILDLIERGDSPIELSKLDRWRLMHIGAQPVPAALIDRWLKVFPNQSYDTNYGLSEAAGPGCVHLGTENTDKVGAIGKAGYGWQTRIIDDDLHDVKSGCRGELCVKGPSVMKCYYKDEKATEDAFFDGWLRTGDIVEEDEDGFIYLVDRKKDVIICGGENIYPVQIESFLRTHPAIRDAAVIGYPDIRLIEIPCAIIAVKPGMALSEDEVREFCNGLPKYKRPRKFIFADVPRNPTGKIEKPLLREKYCKDNSR